MIACTFDRTSSRNADGNSSSVPNRGAAYRHTSARPSAAPNEIARLGPARSSSGTSTGPATARGAIVSRRNPATLTVDSSAGISKNTEPASAIATMASPAALPKCARPYVSSGASERHMRPSGRNSASTMATRPRRMSCHQG